MNTEYSGSVTIYVMPKSFGSHCIHHVSKRARIVVILNGVYAFTIYLDLMVGSCSLDARMAKDMYGVIIWIDGNV